MNELEMGADKELYKSFLSGDTKAYEQLMIRYGDSLTLYLYGYLHDWHDAEDMMIEAFARIMAKKPRIEKDNFKAYLYKTARNLAFRLYHNKNKFMQFSLEEYSLDVEGGELTENLLVSAKKLLKSYKKYFTINKSTGKVTVKKGLKKGTYKVTVKVKAAGTKNYKAVTKTVTFKVKVK